MKKQKKVSLFLLIIITYLVITVIPVAVVGISALDTIRKERENFALAQIQNQVIMVLIINDEIEELLQRITPTNTVRDLILDAGNLSSDKISTDFSMIEYQLLVNDALPPPHTIDIISLDSIIYSTNPGNSYPPEVMSNFVKSVTENENRSYFMGNMGIDRHYPDVSMITSIQPIYQPNTTFTPGDIIGFVVIHYSIDEVFASPDSTDEVQEAITEQPTLNPQGDSNIPDDLSPSSMNTTIIIDKNKRIVSDSKKFMSVIESVDKILPDQMTDSGKFNLKINSYEYQFHYQKIDEIDSYLIDVKPATIIANLISNYCGTTLLVLVAYLLMITLFSYGTRKMVLAPIYEIVTSLDEIHKGSFDWKRRIKVSWLKEFDDLVKLFNHFLDSQNLQKKTELALMSSEAKYRSLFMNSPIPLVEEDLSGILDAVHELGLAGEQLLTFLRNNHAAVIDLVARIRVIDANQEALRLLQAKSKDEIQANLINIYLKYGTSWFIEQVLQVVNRTPQFSQVIKLATLKQKEMTLSTRWSVFPENLDAMDRVVISMLDVTEQEKSNKLREALLKISQDADTVESIHDLYESIHRTLARLMDVNNFYIANYAEATGLISFPYFVDEFDPTPPDREFGNGWTELVITSGKPVLITEPMVKTILLDDQQEMGTEPLCWLGVPLIVKDKTIGVVVVQSYSPLTSYTPEDRDVLMIIANQIALAISEKKTEAKLLHASTHDELTGLYNRAYYEAEILRLKAGRNEPVGVIMMDIDGLKFTNDHFGHAAGDQLIQESAKILHEVFRSNDVIARIGGDEFAVLLPESNLAVVKEAISRVMSKVAAHRLDALPVKLSLSLGGCTTEEHTLQEAIILADQQMYRNKSIQKMKNSHLDQ